jgi:hypothetical protein
MQFFYHLFELNSKFCVCSFYDANEAHKIEELSLLFFVYNFEHYKVCAVEVWWPMGIHPFL